jgi:hypothetical protein
MKQLGRKVSHDGFSSDFLIVTEVTLDGDQLIFTAENGSVRIRDAAFNFWEWKE